MSREVSRKRIVVYLTEDKHAEIKTFCAKLRISMSWFVALAIKDKMKIETEKMNEKPIFQTMSISEEGYVSFVKKERE